MISPPLRGKDDFEVIGKPYSLCFLVSVIALLPSTEDINDALLTSRM